MSVNPYNTRNNPHKEAMFSATAELNHRAAQAGNKQVASIIEEHKQQSSWKGLAFKAAKIVSVASLALFTGALMYECYDHQKSTDELFSLNVDFGKNKMITDFSGYITQIAKQYPSLQCRIGATLTDLVDCYARGMTEYNIKG